MDVNDLKGLFSEVSKRMDVALEHVKHELAGVRTGRASTALLDHVQVEAYGTTRRCSHQSSVRSASPISA